MTVLAMPLPPKAADPARKAIAEAIAAERSALELLAAHRAAIERARALVVTAEDALAAVQKTVADAREAEGRRAADAVLKSTARSRSDALRQARAAECDAEDDLESARLALTQIEGETAQRENDVATARATVGSAVNLFCLPLVEAALRRAQNSKWGYLASEVLVQALGDPLSGIYRDSRSFFGSGLGNEALFPRLSALRKDLEGLHATLHHDPDAPLPPTLDIA